MASTTAVAVGRRLCHRDLEDRRLHGGRCLLDGARPRPRLIGIEGRGLGEGLGHRRETRRVVLGEEALEERGHVGLEGRDARLDALDAALDLGGVRLDLALEHFLPMGHALVGLLADPRDLGLGPLADRRDVVIGLLAQLGRLVSRAGVDALDVGLRLGREPLERVGARRLGSDLHGLGEVGHELVGLARRGRARGRASGLVRHGRLLGTASLDGVGAVSIIVGVSLSLCGWD